MFTVWNDVRGMLYFAFAKRSGTAAVLAILGFTVIWWY